MTDPDIAGRGGSRHRLADGRNAELSERLDALDRLLERGLRHRPATFDGLKLPIPPPSTDGGDEDRQTERQRVALFNDDIEQRLLGFRQADPTAVIWYAERILNPSRYPLEVLNPLNLTFDQDSREFTVELAAPPRSVVPPIGGFRYDPAGDAVVPTARDAGDSARRYRDLISQLVLRVAHELLAARPTNVIGAVNIALWPDESTHKAGAVPLFTTRCDRDSFGTLMGLLTPGGHQAPTATPPGWFGDPAPAPPPPTVDAHIRSRRDRLAQLHSAGDAENPAE